MSSIDLDAMLAPISEDEPCGPSLSYDPAYIELETKAEGTPEQRIGESVIEAVEPNWKEVGRDAVELLGRTKDLRLMVLLSTARIETDGFPGLRDGLRLLRETIERYWEPVHPLLDPDDDNDPTERVNILASLAIPTTSFNDPLRFVRKVESAPLTNSKTLGRFGMRHLKVATGEASGESSGDAGGSSAHDPGTISAAFEDTSTEDLVEIVDAVRDSLEEVTQIDALMTEKVGAAAAADFSPLIDTLKSALPIIQEHLERRGVGVEAEKGEDGEDGEEAESGGARLSGEIRSRDDVLNALEKICTYYKQYEPSSPVPVLIRRAQRLVTRSFIEIIRDLAPSGLSEIEVISGDASGSSDD